MPTNPYETPPNSEESRDADTAFSDLENARIRLRIPAGCLVASSLLSMLVDLVLPLRIHADSANDSMTQPIVIAAVLLVTHFMIFWGASRMLQVRHITQARIGAILALIPCLSPLYVVGVPFGLWALLVMSSDSVKASFRE